MASFTDGPLFVNSNCGGCDVANIWAILRRTHIRLIGKWLTTRTAHRCVSLGIPSTLSSTVYDNRKCKERIRACSFSLARKDVKDRAPSTTQLVTCSKQGPLRAGNALISDSCLTSGCASYTSPASLQPGAGVAAPLPPSVLCTAPLTPSWLGTAHPIFRVRS